MPLTWTNINGLKNCKNAFLFSFNFPWNTFLCFSARSSMCMTWNHFFATSEKKLNCSTKSVQRFFIPFMRTEKKAEKIVERVYIGHMFSTTHLAGDAFCCVLAFALLIYFRRWRIPGPYAAQHYETIKSSAFTVSGALSTCFCCFGSCLASVKALLGDVST